jgi:hypothetical protein
MGMGGGRDIPGGKNEICLDTSFLVQTVKKFVRSERAVMCVRLT